MVPLQKFHEKYAQTGLQVFIVAMHPDPDFARRTADELKVTYPIFNGYGSDLGRLYAYG